MSFYLGLVLGLMIGVPAGGLILASCFLAKRADEHEQECQGVDRQNR